MKSLLKFFGLSFFSDKIAKEARIRGVLNCVLAFLFALIFIYCGVLAANTIPFYTHYNKAADFKSFLYDVIDRENLSIADKLVSADKVVNTFEDDDDAAAYLKSGYNLVIDTRPADTPDDFEAYCISKDGMQEVTYSRYLAMTDNEKNNYEFRLRYTPNVLNLTDEMIADCESYLGGCGDGDIKKQFEEILSDKDNVAAEQYKSKVYALYVKAYYPDISAFERAGDVPLLRSYYYRNYLNSNDISKSLFIFDDVLFGYFRTDGGVEVAFYGSYNGIRDGKLTVEGADEFVTNAFASSVSTSANVYIMNIFRFIPLIAVIPLILALLAMLALRLIKDEKNKKYTTCLKIEFSYLAVAALLTALIMFVCGYFVSSDTLNILPLIILALVMFARTAVLLIGEYLVVKKQPQPTPNEETE